MVISFVRCWVSYHQAIHWKSISILFEWLEEEENHKKSGGCDTRPPIYNRLKYHSSLPFMCCHHCIWEWTISAADIAILVVVVDTCGTHQRESPRETRVTCEVDRVIKSGITRDTQAVVVFIKLLRALILCEFESGCVSLLRVGSQVVRSVGSTSHWCSLSELSSDNPLEKYFQFYSHTVTHSNTIDGQTEELVCRVRSNGLLGRAHRCHGTAWSTSRM